MFSGLGPLARWLTIDSPVTIADWLFDQRCSNVLLEVHRKEPAEARCDC